MSSVHLRRLAVRFGRQQVLHELDLEIESGEFLVLLGPSGCGKSTLLHSIAGLIDGHAGRVEIGGRDMTGCEPSARGIGMVFQSYALYPTMSVERNLSFGLRVAGLPRAEVEERVRRVARMLQLEPLLARKPAHLSGGQRQRVAIGRALVREASVYLLDEPLSNLDAQLRAELRRELKLLHRRLGATMIYVTHDQVEAMTLASRIVVMRAGCIQQVGTPAQVYERPRNRFVAGFVGAPAMNFVDGTLQTGDAGANFVCPQFALDLAADAFETQARSGQAVVLGVRPEDVLVHAATDARGAWPGAVQLVEPMGNQQVVWLDCQGLTLAALLPAGRRLVADQAVSVSIECRRVSLFDRDSEQRL